MSFIQDIYYTTDFKKSYESNYNFNVPLDVNIDIKPNEKIKFKLIDFSIMNSMLNVSSYHKNNSFKVLFRGTNYTITIPNGNYTATSLRDEINSILVSQTISIAFNYDKTTNKYYLITADNVVAGELFFYPQNCASLFGFTNSSYELIYPNEYYSDTYVNMLPYSKILLTTNLAFDVNIQHNLERKYSANSGNNDIVHWFDRDVPPFTTINYTNNNNKEILISNNNITSINFSIMNEYQEYIIDAPKCYIHFQLIVYETINWNKLLVNKINDISFYLLSLIKSNKKRNKNIIHN